MQFFQTVIYDRLKGATQSLLFNQNAECNVTRGINISQTLNFVSSANCVKLSRTDLSTEISAEASPGNLENARIVTFQCGTDTIILPSPDFENQEKEAFNRVNRRTRGGDLYIYRASFWPKSETFGMRWSNLSEKQAKDLLIFLQRSAGKLVIFTDFENRSFTGLIKSPNNEIVQTSRYLFSTSFEFECQ